MKATKKTEINDWPRVCLRSLSAVVIAAVQTEKATKIARTRSN